MTIQNILRLLACTGMLAFTLTGCGEDPIDQPIPPEQEDSYGVVNFVNPAQDRLVSSNGETVSCVLMTEAAYQIDMVFNSGGEDWAELSKGDTGVTGRNTVRLVFDKNTTDQARELELFIQVEGYERVSLCTFVQMKDSDIAAKQKNEALNTYMHRRLQKEYLWEQYNSIEVDLSMDYTQFLNAHLLKLGDINVEDGGRYRANSSNPGKRFIYSNIQEVEVVSKVIETQSLGFGPIFSSQINEQGTIGLSIAYVHQGSPAWEAGMKRGDTIFKVNGVLLTNSNYKDYMTALYYSPSGTYEFEFIRDADVTKQYGVKVTTGVYRYNPVLYSAVISEGNHKIGYLVLENFDLDAQDFVVDIIQQLKDNAITDLILDLRFNPGGAVAQSRYLASAIAGTAHLDDVFVQVDFRGSKHQDWKLRGGPNDEDGLGIAPDLGLKRLYVIGSENTASASELIINGLRGIDFPVYLYGSQTEGKNVGMTTTQTTYEGIRYLFSPITFRVANAKGFGEYPDGFKPDVMVNNQNSSYADDKDNTFPYSFGDWGDMGFNVALRLAYEDIIGVTRSDMRSARSLELEPVILDHTGLMQPQHGRFGNVIYLKD